MDDEAHYETVAKEVAAGDIKPGLWAKAFAQAEGKTEIARAIYIRLRAEQLISEAKAQSKADARAERSRRSDRFMGCLGSVFGLLSVGLMLWGTLWIMYVLSALPWFDEFWEGAQSVDPWTKAEINASGFAFLIGLVFGIASDRLRGRRGWFPLLRTPPRR